MWRRLGPTHCNAIQTFTLVSLVSFFLSIDITKVLNFCLDWLIRKCQPEHVFENLRGEEATLTLAPRLPTQPFTYPTNFKVLT